MQWSHSVLALAILASSAACHARAPGAAETATATGQAPRQLREIPGCEGCEAAWEREPQTLTPSIRLAAPSEPGEPLLLQGTIYKADGRTPAPGVVLYIHHTNDAGVYGNGTNESVWSRRHGRLRGWLRTGPDGRYAVHTIRPGEYPGRADPAHIHLTIWEAGKDPYWIDDVAFAGEPHVNATYRAERENRGGPGIVQLKREASGRWLAGRDIVLLK